MKKSTLFILFAIILAFLTIEFFSFVTLKILSPSWAVAQANFESSEKGVAHLNEIADAKQKVPEHAKDERLHPYMGFSMQPEPGKDEFGFYNHESLLQKRSSDQYIVAIMGGSVSYHLWYYSRDIFIAALKQNPAFKDKKIVFLNLALQGGKQPQQLMILNYLLTLGAEFDAILNLDGFNEVALSGHGYMNWKLFPGFPRDWPLRINQYQSPELLKALGKYALIKDLRQSADQRFEKSFFRASFTAKLLYGLYRHLLVGAAYRTYVGIQSVNMEQPDSASRGLIRDYENYGLLYQDVAGIWQESSRLMKAVCDVHKIKYLHFLQPNQYVPESKNFTQEERDSFYKGDHVYKYGVENGYPYLIQAGIQLAAEGVDFHNLSFMWRGYDSTVYNDDCCHFNQEGNNMLAQVLAKVFLGELSYHPA